jgi:hypothetical protein
VTTKVEPSEIRVDTAGAITHAAKQYPLVLQAILEMVQNALDAKAKFINIRVNLKNRTLEVTDTGTGRSRAEFDVALQSVFRSQKEQTALGQFGIGLMSWMDKCKRYSFTSVAPNHTTGYLRWTFDPVRILERGDRRIPPEEIPDLRFTPYVDQGRPKWEVPWRSRVLVESFKLDKTFKRLTLADLEAEILKNFNQALRSNGAWVQLEIFDLAGKVQVLGVHPRTFAGQQLPVVTLTKRDCGRTEFRLYLAPATQHGRRGKVEIGVFGRDFRMPVAYALKQEACLCSQDAVQALLGGAFEGEVLTTLAQFNPNRRGFIEDDAYADLCEVLDRWFEQHGKGYLEELKSAKEDDRFQRIALAALDAIDKLLEDPRNQHLKDVIQSFKFGTVGPGHHRPGKRAVVGTQGATSLAVGGQPLRPRGSTNGDSREREDPVTEHPGHTPLTAVGPLGIRRTIVRGGSRGIQFAKVVMLGSPLVWNLRKEEGVLEFNSAHPLWQKVDRSDRAVQWFMEHVFLHAFSILARPSAEQMAMRETFDKLLESTVPHTIDSLEARRSTAKLPKPKGKRTATRR